MSHTIAFHSILYPPTNDFPMAATAENIGTLIKTDITITLIPDLVHQILSQPPFVSVPGVFNIRDIGHVPIVRRNFIFRSGMLSGIEAAGKAKLISELRVKKIFDLRSAPERMRLGTPHISGVEICWMPEIREPMLIDLIQFGAEDGGLRATFHLYADILETHVPIFRQVFQHIRDEGDQPILFHCAAGKDRTGVLTALILSLVGCSHGAIAWDFSLTRIGVEPFREIVLKDLLSSAVDCNPELTKGIVGLCNINFDAMILFLQQLEATYERGAEGYVMNILGFSSEDVSIIRRNLYGQ
ncbi:hypothetical protein LOZ12_000787 [Ophidiomyces ophidiicola]|uniref:Uncharacterized protein n=1 Tax=Ophidiomyces ophidiicola TaxID=1387563 RepID=A0ACB8V4V8_9EURO|nr:uncharacterized protein LOZ57_005444 [Ophidiomyces ophidiicola]KAI1917370.1 hypothetical protein LOZ61_000433 [Ophidiomyces ophidiicola]KAI1924403.1 hypothetical protein LOZ64_000728 [Ophidiomyces ophidiicola]KAI1929304.1 hypothetical protein LOZ60_001773 [Ophidiomyces ophidiicola]KAI1942221.1 hypothetical protein LOZ57_005444 [Ophidiomyces ophidiicola]KAI1947242.1 hypothetical protein LOZ62_003080 [Ophidiomyces ophidiicola]